MSARGAVMLSCALAVLVARPPAARACVCLADARVSYPPAGAPDVPVNAVIVIDAWSPAPAVVVRDLESGGEVATSTEELGPPGAGGAGLVLLVRPTTRFADTHRYAISVGGADEDVEFTTGAAADETPPAAPAVTLLSIESMEPEGELLCFDSCVEDPRNFNRAELEWPEHEPDVTLLLIELRRADEAAPFATVPVPVGPARRSFTMEDTTCEVRPPDLPPGTYCARFVAQDRAGNRSAAGPELCAETLACALTCDSLIGPDPLRCGPPSDDGGACAVAHSRLWPLPTAALFLLLFVLTRRPMRRGP